MLTSCGIMGAFNVFRSRASKLQANFSIFIKGHSDVQMGQYYMGADRGL